MRALALALCLVASAAHADVMRGYITSRQGYLKVKYRYTWDGSCFKGKLACRGRTGRVRMCRTFDSIITDARSQRVCHIFSGPMNWGPTHIEGILGRCKLCGSKAHYGDIDMD